MLVNFFQLTQSCTTWATTSEKLFIKSRSGERREEVSEFLHHLSQDTANEINLNFFCSLLLILLAATEVGGKCEEMENIIFTTWKNSFIYTSRLEVKEMTKSLLPLLESTYLIFPSSFFHFCKHLIFFSLNKHDPNSVKAAS